MSKKRQEKDPQFKVRLYKWDKIYKIVRSPKQQKKFNTNKWNSDQNRKYIDFLQENLLMFLNPLKKNKIYCLMAKNIKTRNSIQCKSHHIKALKKYGNNLETLIQVNFQKSKHSPSVESQFQVDLQMCPISNILNSQASNQNRGVTLERCSQNVVLSRYPNETCQEQELFNVLNLKSQQR